MVRFTQLPKFSFLLGVHTLLTTHLSAILRENHSVVQDSIQVVVDQALEQHHQAAKVINSQFPFPTPSKKKIARYMADEA